MKTKRYFFFDSTQGAKFGLIAHAALLSCLGLFFVLAVGLDELMDLATNQYAVPLPVQGTLLALVTFTICKFRD
jgi:hypothetical protein